MTKFDDCLVQLWNLRFESIVKWFISLAETEGTRAHRNERYPYCGAGAVGGAEQTHTRR